MQSYPAVYVGSKLQATVLESRLAALCGIDPMDDRTRYETVKSRLRAMGEGTAQQVHAAMEEHNPYSVREVENTLDEMVIHERDEFEQVGGVYAHRINRSRGKSF